MLRFAADSNDDLDHAMQQAANKLVAKIREAAHRGRGKRSVADRVLVARGTNNVLKDYAGGPPMKFAAFDAWVERARAVPIGREIERRGIELNGGKIERCGPCPRCGGDDRFSINTAKGVFNCRGCGAKGDVIDLVRFLDECDFIAAGTKLTGEPPPKAKTNGKDRAGTAKEIVAARFDYLDEAGNLLFQVERVEFQSPDGSFVLKDGKRKKTFHQRRPDPERQGKWIWNVDGVPIVPYRLPELPEAVAAGHPLLIVEGELKADLLWSWNIPATCCAGGAKKWKREHSEFLARRGCGHRSRQ